MIVVVMSYGLKPSGLYRHRIGLGLHKVGYNGRRSTYPYRQACLPRQGKSHPDTGRSLQSCIFIVQESGWRYSPATRTPPNPGLPQLPFTITHDDFDIYNMHVLAAPTCNYYERGTISPPLYVSNMIKLQETAYTMHWPLLGVHELFFYDMPMHRKRVRLRHYLIYVTLCSLLNYKSLLIKIGFYIPWDPGGSITWALYA